jgi:hypothetical protein
MPMVDVEDPAPGGVVDEEAAEQGPGHRGQSKDGAEVAHVAAALAGGDDVADDRLRTDHQAPGTDALEGPEADQLGHVLGEPAEHRSDQEDDDRALEDALAPVQVSDLPVERCRDRRGEDVRGHHPRELGEAAQVAHDGGQCGGDDGLVERGDQHRQHQGAEHHHEPPPLGVAPALDLERRDLGAHAAVSAAGALVITGELCFR